MEMQLQEKLCNWLNLRWAYEAASRGKRGREATAKFEMYLGDNLLNLQESLEQKTYQPGGYRSFYVHEPKRRLISAAPFRDRVAHHALCNVTNYYFEQRFISASYANRFGKGTHKAIDHCQKLARRHKYFLLSFFFVPIYGMLETALPGSFVIIHLTTRLCGSSLFITASSH